MLVGDEDSGGEGDEAEEQDGEAEGEVEVAGGAGEVHGALEGSQVCYLTTGSLAHRHKRS